MNQWHGTLFEGHGGRYDRERFVHGKAGDATLLVRSQGLGGSAKGADSMGFGI